MNNLWAYYKHTWLTAFHTGVIESPFLLWAMTHFFLAGWMFFFIISAIDNVGAIFVGMFLAVSLAANLWLGYRALGEIRKVDDMAEGGLALAAEAESQAAGEVPVPWEECKDALEKLDEDFGSTPHKGPLVITEIAVDEKEAKKLDLLNEVRTVEREA
jgi:hypothetical protein